MFDNLIIEPIKGGCKVTNKVTGKTIYSQYKNDEYKELIEYGLFVIYEECEEDVNIFCNLHIYNIEEGEIVFNKIIEEIQKYKEVVNNI